MYTCTYVHMYTYTSKYYMYTIHIVIHVHNYTHIVHNYTHIVIHVHIHIIIVIHVHIHIIIVIHVHILIQSYKYKYYILQYTCHYVTLDCILIFYGLSVYDWFLYLYSCVTYTLYM